MRLAQLWCAGSGAASGVLFPAGGASWRHACCRRSSVVLAAYESGGGETWDGESKEKEWSAWSGPSEEEEAVASYLESVEEASASPAEEEVTESVTEVTEEAEDAAIRELQPSMEELMEVGIVADERLGEVSSHELVDVDEDGDPVVDRDRMVFVDEVACIGCTNCACIAPQTFMMEQDHGRARAYQQDGDLDEVIAEAVATCPVDCIHYVPWDELVSLERKRDKVMTEYNFKGRLVGSDGLRSTNGAGQALLSISSNNAARCANCPSNQCPECPMFSVGDEQAREDVRDGKVRKRCGNCPTNGCVGCPLAAENPEYQKRRARREIKRKQRAKTRRDEILQKIDDASSRPVDL